MGVGAWLCRELCLCSTQGSAGVRDRTVTVLGWGRTQTKQPVAFSPGRRQCRAGYNCQGRGKGGTWICTVGCKGTPCWTPHEGSLNPLQGQTAKLTATVAFLTQNCSCRVLLTCTRQGRCGKATSVAMVTAVRVTRAGLEWNGKRRLGCLVTGVCCGGGPGWWF